jgi:polysaccharide chain length determinant protein (PEP-CTERM system associated)
MKEIFDEVFDQAITAWRFRRVAVLTACAATVLGWFVVLAWPDSYEASARVYVNTATALKPVLQGLAVEQDVDAQMNMVRETLLGRPRLEHVIRALNLDAGADTPEKKDRLVARLQASILIDAQAAKTPGREARGGDSVYTITYRNKDRAIAIAVVDALLQELVGGAVSDKRVGSDKAQKFLGSQIKDYEARLSEAESKLADFKKKNLGLVPGEQGDYFARLQAEMLAAKKSESSLEVALRRKGELERQLRGEKPFAAGATGASREGASQGARGGAQSLVGGETALRIAEAQAKLDDLLLRYTDRHPDVLAVKETLTQLKARQVAEMEAVKRGDPTAAASTGLAANPVYQSILLQMNQVDVEIAALRGDLADHQRTEAELRRVANTAPEVEAEFARLTRDYTVEKAQYTSLVERLEKAKLSDDAADTGMVQFQLINPPTADRFPVAPNRPLLISLVLLGAIALGAALAWVLAQFRPVFTSARALGDLTGLPVLGTIRRTWLDDHHAVMQSSLRKLGTVGAVLCVCFVALLVLHSPGARLLHQIFRI